VISRLPRSFRDSAYFDERGGEAAWPRSEALRVLEWAGANRLAVLGGEVWLPTRPGPTIPTPHVYEWTIVPRYPEEAWQAFVSRSVAQSVQYVSGFDWADQDKAHHALEPYFNLVLVDEAGG
jgi:hypothetical protein